MKSDGLLRHAVIAAIIALAVYGVTYGWIEHRRTRNGPWQVAFTNVAGAPALIVNEPALKIEKVRISFPGQTVSASNAVMSFAEPRDTPFAVPFGECAFMDTTFQPGTVVFRTFGHEIQLIRRVLTIDKKEYAWESVRTIEVRP